MGEFNGKQNDSKKKKSDKEMDNKWVGGRYLGCECRSGGGQEYE